ncbi:MAG: Asp-tRNA(Asn)/Glu-tRNA(Gln) amidotransferase subunit GatC [Candidatus Nealsonbacteria bacterium]|nr:Asp-tRNA(Asn)/Glu-tRNA(Gln) amidotransferase subunit GatC [Candidatus Nealsonbacteria bacterium]
MISREQVEHVAQLARLDLSEKEIEKMQKDLSSILDYIEKLQEVDISGVEIEATSKNIEKVARKDTVETGPPEERKDLIGMMPEEKNKYLKIKKVFE